MFEIKQNKSRFIIFDDKKEIGEITFIDDNKGNFVVNRTFVDPNYRGQRLAKRLVETMVAHAKEKNKKIIPTCPYVLGLFQNDDTYLDVWNQNAHDYEVACQFGS